MFSNKPHEMKGQVWSEEVAREYLLILQAMIDFIDHRDET